MDGGEWERYGVAAEDLSLATDLYQLTMAAAYARHGAGRQGSFELSVRRLPPRRNFLVFAGLEPALAALRSARFSPRQLDYLRGLPVFAGTGDEIFARFADFRFRGDVWAMEEGTIFFPGEPVMRVSGELLEAQIVETLLLSIVNFQTTIASKAVRVRLAAGKDVRLAEFGTRRAHGPQAGLWVARAAYLAGFDSTSNVLAGLRLGIPVAGTMAHSFVMAAPSETQAFRDYQSAFPEHAILLVDTYDTLRGVERALSMGVPFAGVRLDSGDLLTLSRRVRRLLDDGGAPEALIFASGDVDEERIRELRAGGAPIDAYGVGSKLATAADAPYTGGVYKLVEVVEDGRRRPTFKSSVGKLSLPGCKQVWRRTREGELAGDTLTLAGEAGPSEPPDGAAPLLRQVMAQGEVVERRSLEQARRRLESDLAALPAALRDLDPAPAPYPVGVAPDIERLLGAASGGDQRLRK